MISTSGKPPKLKREFFSLKRAEGPKAGFAAWLENLGLGVQNTLLYINGT